MTFGNDVAQILPGAVCDVGLGTADTPFKITMISRGLIDISGSEHYLEPAVHGVLAWTDQRFNDEATSTKIAGSNATIGPLAPGCGAAPAAFLPLLID